MTGQCLVKKLLDLGAYVRATEFKTRKIDIRHKKLEIIPCDLSVEIQAREVLKDMDIVFWTAGKHGGVKTVTHGLKDIIMYYLDISSRFMNYAVDAKVDRYAIISSSFVYPPSLKPNKEEEGFNGDPIKPTYYAQGWVHRYLETLCKFFHMTSQTNFAIIRPTAMYGPYDIFDLEMGHVVPALIRKAVERMDPFEVWGTGQEIRSFIYIDDLADGLILAAERYAVSDPLNICNPVSNSINDVVSHLFEILDFHPQIVYNLSKPASVSYKVSDPTKARDFLGFWAKTTLKEGLEKTVQWYVNHVKQQSLS